MKVTDEKVLERLTSKDNLMNLLQDYREAGDFSIHNKTHKSQGKIPESVKLAAGIAAQTDGTRQAAEVFDVSKVTVGDAASGRLHSGHNHTYVDEEFRDRVKGSGQLEESIKGAALDKMFECITTLDVSTLKAKDKATVAAQLSQAAKNLSKDVGIRTAKILIINPGTRAISEYDSIDV